MECIKIDTNMYNRGVTDMENTNENNNESNSRQNTAIRFFKEKIIYTGIGAIVVAAITCIAIFGKTEARLDAIEKNFSDLSTNINNNFSDISSDIEDIKIALYGNYNTKGLYERVSSIENRVSSIESQLNMKAVSASDDVVSYLDNATISSNNVPISTSAIPSDICIGSDANGKEILASDVINETVFLTYNENDKEVYFLGQFDENYHWDGFCVTNTYNTDGTLFGICESNFDGGNRLDYISFYADNETENEWIYTNRICKDDGNHGESICYHLMYDKIKNFTNTNVRVSDFIYIDDFIMGQVPTVLTYYNGKTLDGKFNDDSNNSYFIKFDKDGYVSIFYIGSFKNGNFDSENAKELIYDDTEGVNGYLYYDGAFDDGNRLHEITIEDKIDQAHIDLIIGEIDLSQEVKSNLKWR